MANKLATISNLLDADVPVLLWGPPGTGKTAALLALAKERDAYAEVLIGSTLDPIDIGGYLVPSASGEVRSTPPPWARRIRAELDAGRKAWLMLDELSCAPPLVQAALLRVVHERRVGDLDLRGCSVVAAANPSDTAADGGELSAATANRWAHLEWEVDPQRWIAGTLSGWGVALMAKQAASTASITAWIARSPQALLALPTGAQAGRAWPSPRSWTHAIRVMAYAQSAEVLSAVSACVGEAAALEWHTYHVARDLPDPEEVLSGSAKLPNRGDRVMATLFSVVAIALIDHPERSVRIARAWECLTSVRPDVALSSARALLEATGDVPDIARDLGRRILALKGDGR